MIELIRQRVLPHYSIAANSAIAASSAGEIKISPLGNGHINDTFLVRAGGTELVLQRLNTQVFPDPWTLVNNAALIDAHLQRQQAAGRFRLQRIDPQLTLDGKLAVDLGADGFWRAIRFLPHSTSLEVVGSIAEARQAAAAFGHFAMALSDFNASLLGDVIPNFHHLPGRMAQLQQAVAADKAGRVAECQDWLSFVQQQQPLLDELAQTLPNLPLRVCHNDTKINNMLFDKRDGSAMAIIDLDTCMRGQLMYDFGDMVRTFTSPEAEDSRNLDKVRVRPEMFAAICEGFLGELGQVLTQAERHSLWLGARVMCLMIGVRFLTDHLNGDVYFHIQREGHNLDRAANQFSLYLSLLAQADSLKACLS
ncbi:phosphotransferase enzyme family protein [Shewanella cyperi]|uniref:phosphotransferase enzyme family protein n=1 Tax=Shewanella cyperi TaxID=2814292 RepID=UPI001A94E9DF|nr:aminoglycoside phosphotransferase family protein [Shewanella cyperi]QSX41117.1 aminoglycoside phosphotransferase family protein [Shewanella cyperi]